MNSNNQVTLQITGGQEITLQFIQVSGYPYQNVPVSLSPGESITWQVNK